MTNKYRNETEITLGDNTYTLRPTFSAIVAIESHFNTGIITLLQSIGDGYELTLLDIFTTVKVGCVTKVDEDQLKQDLVNEGIISSRDQLAAFFSYCLNGGEQLKKE